MVKQVFKSTSSKKRESELVVSFREGEVIFEEGDLGTEMYIVHEGKVEILKRFKDELRQLAMLGQGDFFGEMSILEDLPRTASARARSDVKAVPINGSTFVQMLRKNPEIAVRMMRKLSRRLRETDQMLRRALGAEESQAPEMPTPDSTSERPKGQERLVHDSSDLEFYLSAGAETTVGRRDPVTGINPDIDLTPADAQRSISRRHAKIFRRDGRFYLREEIG
ncbi:MAG: cyclic nucleotide-binding domain-containing protein, partial [Holophagales bacterium]|nr:cyclic nucleotide-binding domain-containing protein [Holophagales bacterium]